MAESMPERIDRVDRARVCLSLNGATSRDATGLMDHITRHSVQKNDRVGTGGHGVRSLGDWLPWLSSPAAYCQRRYLLLAMFPETKK